MGFRFWRRVRIAPGITMNLSKSGGSFSFGRRGAKFTVGTSGKRFTVGVPGTGLFYTTTGSGSSPRSRSQSGYAASLPPLPAANASNRLTLGFFKKLITPEEEQYFINGCREMVAGNKDKALEYLRQSTHLADGAYLAGFLALTKGQFQEAVAHLKLAAQNHRKLGCYFAKYDLSATMLLPITEEIAAYTGPTLRGVLLGLTEAYQRQRQWQNALACLRKLRRLLPDDIVVKLSLVELMLEVDPHGRATCQQVVRLTGTVENESALHTALLLYKARALRELGLFTGARDTLTTALRRKKGRPQELLQALRYERALVYEALGHSARARSDFEKLYAENPSYKDVAKRLNLQES